MSRALKKEIQQHKILRFDELKTLRERLPGETLVHCHGVFDVLHPGHASHFEEAKKFGTKLVVTVTADEFVNKGPGRPYFPAQVRAEMLAALEIVDFVAINSNPTAVPAIEELRPHFYVKGPDYADRTKDVTGGIYEEENAVKASGGSLVFTKGATHSSSKLINLFFQNWNQEQEKAIRAVKRVGGLPLVEEMLARLAKERVTVAGEPIVDTYRWCFPENISSKSPSISARLLSEENHLGGSLAIANHLADFMGEVRLVISHGGEPYFTELLKTGMDPRVHILGEVVPGVPTPRKTRYVAEERRQNIFEITEIRSDQWTTHSCERVAKELEGSSHDTKFSILADFGHGFFEGAMLSRVSALKGFMALNVQTNSSNFGFNPFTKHSRFDYLSLDTKEVRLAYHDRYSSAIELARRLQQELGSADVCFSLTLGSSGSHFFRSGKSPASYHSPAFVEHVIDATGAGDAYFAITSGLLKIGCPGELIPFLGNVFAGLHTKVIGNRTPVTRAQFQKAVTSILK
jgi:rfaE bifunctional protein nucleotidyltransferase chain/domain